MLASSTLSGCGGETTREQTPEYLEEARKNKMDVLKKFAEPGPGAKGRSVRTKKGPAPKPEDLF